MDNKKLNVYDNQEFNDRHFFKKTNVVIKVEGTDEVVFRGHNKVIISGSAFGAEKFFNINPTALTPSYNTVLGLEGTVSEPFQESGIRRDELVYLFAVGIGGCGQENSQVYDVNYTKWIDPATELVPFRYQLETNDISPELREKYFGRRAVNGRIIYYFKGFENEPVLKQQYIDGTPIDENIYASTRTDEVETFVELKLNVSRYDCRDFFASTVGINEARINTLSLLTAWKKEIDGYTYYQDIRPLTKINFPNESLIDPGKGLDITYQLFF